jgi:hypothetical protein
MGEHVPMERNVPSFERGLGDHVYLRDKTRTRSLKCIRRYDDMKSCKGDYEDRNDQ